MTAGSQLSSNFCPLLDNLVSIESREPQFAKYVQLPGRRSKKGRY